MGMALYTGVTGLLAHQRRLDVVANNIANINTTGYRASRVQFQDIFSMTLEGGSGPNGNFGGNNPMQIGLGAGLGSVDVIHTEGSLLNTGVASDLAIQGNGFFIMNQGNGNFSYSRDGSFSQNNLGTLVDSSGRAVQGWLADANGAVNTGTTTSNLQFTLGGSASAQATSATTLVGNLEAQAANGSTVTRTMKVYDSLGTPRDVIITFTKDSATANTWTYDAQFNGASVGSGTLSFQADGTLAANTTGNIAITAAQLNTTGAQPDNLNFTIDFSKVTQLDIDAELGSDISMTSQNGFPLGVLDSFSVGGNGEVMGVFSNGLRRTIGQLAIANFANVGGLSRSGDNSFVETTASGVAQIGLPSSGGRGTIAGGVLEGSNVDLGTEFTSLIVTQRGYQANARTITAADTLMQETVNLIR